MDAECLDLRAMCPYCSPFHHPTTVSTRLSLTGRVMCLSCESWVVGEHAVCGVVTTSRQTPQSTIALSLALDWTAACDVRRDPNRSKLGSPHRHMISTTWHPHDRCGHNPRFEYSRILSFVTSLPDDLRRTVPCAQTRAHSG
jgi:hypothetical protein